MCVDAESKSPTSYLLLSVRGRRKGVGGRKKEREGKREGERGREREREGGEK